MVPSALHTQGMLLLSMIELVSGHGAMLEPPARNIENPPESLTCTWPKKIQDIPESDGRRYNYQTYGRFLNKLLNGNKATDGLKDNHLFKPNEVADACGKMLLDLPDKPGEPVPILPFDEYKAGEFGVAKTYKPGDTLKFKFKLTAKHGGLSWLDFACVDGNEGKFAKDLDWIRLKKPNGDTTENWGTQGQGSHLREYDVVLPDKECKHGIVQWTWFGRQNIEAGKPDTETFTNCADIAISASDSGGRCSDPNLQFPDSGGGSNGEGSDGGSSNGGSSNVGGSNGGSSNGGSSNAGGSNGENSNAGGSNGDDSSGPNLVVILSIVGAVVALVSLFAYLYFKNRQDGKHTETPANTVAYIGKKPSIRKRNNSQNRRGP